MFFVKRGFCIVLVFFLLIKGKIKIGGSLCLEFLVYFLAVLLALKQEIFVKIIFFYLGFFKIQCNKK